MKSLLLIFIVFFISSRLLAQELSSPPRQVSSYEHQIGICAINVGDIGEIYQLSYRLFYKKAGINLTVYPFASNYLKEYNVGISFLYRFFQREKLEFLLIQNNYYFKSDESITDYFYPKGYFHNGLGVETDFIVKKDVNLNIMAGGCFYKNFDRFVPFVGLGFHYKL
jgi:hypothetical protein